MDDDRPARRGVAAAPLLPATMIFVLQHPLRATPPCLPHSGGNQRVVRSEEAHDTMNEAGFFKVSILKKLRSIPQVKVVGYLAQPSRVLQLRHHAASSSTDWSGPPSLPPLSSRPCRLPHDQPPLPTDPAGRAHRELPVGTAAQNGGQVQQDEGRLRPLCKNLPLLPPTAAEPDIIDVAEHTSDFEDNDIWSFKDGKENTGPVPASPAAQHIHVITPSLPAGRHSSPEKPFLPDKRGARGQHTPPASAQLDDLPTYRRPDFNSCSLFDPDLLAAFEAAVMQHARARDELRRKPLSTADRAAAAAQLREEGEREEAEDGDEEEEEPPCKVPRKTDNVDVVEPRDVADPLRGFEVRCPPGGGGSVVLYTTSLRGIRKTFEGCNSVRLLLRGLRVVFHERDVSMHLGYREELWRILGCRAIPPRLFIRGRHVGGADEVLGLHEQGRLLPLVRGMPPDLSGGLPCERCGGVGFLVCAECSGSRSVYEEGMNGGGEAVRCPHCNENGLVVCTLCCCPAGMGCCLPAPTKDGGPLSQMHRQHHRQPLKSPSCGVPAAIRRGRVDDGMATPLPGIST